MKKIAGFLLCCWKDEQENDKPEPVAIRDQGENEENKSVDELKRLSFDEPDIEKTPENDVTVIKKSKSLKVNRPSIILSMEGSVHHVVLYEEKDLKKKKRSKHKKREKAKKHKKSDC